MGSFFYFSGLIEALRSFARHAQTKSDLKFLLIGGGEQSSELRELAKTLKIADKVIFTGFVSYWDLPDYLSLGQVAINTLTPSLVANTALPNKVLQYLASGLPVVSTRLNGLRSLFSESTRVSWCATSSEVVDIAQEMLFSASILPTKQEALASISSLERFDYKTTLRVFESALLELVKVSPK
jgi:glycosyltransferase involved in cell wall biosynthesis